MKTGFLFIALTFTSVSIQAQTNGWDLLAKTKFETKYNEKAAEYFLYPVFSKELKDWVGKEFSLEGYYLPIEIQDDAYIILSKFPYSQCFFCGGAGPESIAEVTFKVKKEKFEMDEFIHVKGTLRLNENNVEHGNFILENAVRVK